jgi:hypothetical protein
MEIRLQVPKSLLMAMNQLYEIEQKLKHHGDPHGLQRHVGKMKDAFDALDTFGLVYEDPMGQAFNETRTDVEATISGAGTENLIIVEVIKPIIRAVHRGGPGELSKIVQKGIVVVESKKH